MPLLYYWAILYKHNGKVNFSEEENVPKFCSFSRSFFFIPCWLFYLYTYDFLNCIIIVSVIWILKFFSFTGIIFLLFFNISNLQCDFLNGVVSEQVNCWGGVRFNRLNRRVCSEELGPGLLLQWPRPLLISGTTAFSAFLEFYSFGGVCFWAKSGLARSYYWLCAHGSLLTVVRIPYGMPGKESRWTIGKATLYYCSRPRALFFLWVNFRIMC